jgi:hypothetical protein
MEGGYNSNPFFAGKIKHANLPDGPEKILIRPRQYI